MARKLTPGRRYVSPTRQLSLTEAQCARIGIVGNEGGHLRVEDHPRGLLLLPDNADLAAIAQLENAAQAVRRECGEGKARELLHGLANTCGPSVEPPPLQGSAPPPLST